MSATLDFRNYGFQIILCNSDYCVFTIFSFMIRRSMPIILCPFYYCKLGLRGYGEMEQITCVFRSQVLRSNGPTFEAPYLTCCTQTWTCFYRQDSIFELMLEIDENVKSLWREQVDFSQRCGHVDMNYWRQNMDWAKRSSIWTSMILTSFHLHASAASSHIE